MVCLNRWLAARSATLDGSGWPASTRKVQKDSTLTHCRISSTCSHVEHLVCSGDAVSLTYHLCKVLALRLALTSFPLLSLCVHVRLEEAAALYESVLSGTNDSGASQQRPLASSPPAKDPLPAAESAPDLMSDTLGDLDMNSAAARNLQLRRHTAPIPVGPVGTSLLED